MVAGCTMSDSPRRPAHAQDLLLDGMSLASTRFAANLTLYDVPSPTADDTPEALTEAGEVPTAASLTATAVVGHLWWFGEEVAEFDFTKTSMTGITQYVIKQHSLAHADQSVQFSLSVRGSASRGSYSIAPGQRLYPIADTCSVTGVTRGVEWELEQWCYYVDTMASKECGACPSQPCPAPAPAYLDTTHSDGLDNDCDGRIDEEIVNGIDDDGDGAWATRGGVGVPVDARRGGGTPGYACRRPCLARRRACRGAGAPRNAAWPQRPERP